MNNNFNSLFGKAEVPFDCPNCGKKLKIKLGQVGTKPVYCSGCNSNVNVQPDNSYKRSTKTIDKSLKELEKTLKKLSK